MNTQEEIIKKIQEDKINLLEAASLLNITLEELDKILEDNPILPTIETISEVINFHAEISIPERNIKTGRCIYSVKSKNPINYLKSMEAFPSSLIIQSFIAQQNTMEEYLQIETLKPRIQTRTSYYRDEINSYIGNEELENGQYNWNYCN